METHRVIYSDILPASDIIFSERRCQSIFSFDDSRIRDESNTCPKTPSGSVRLRRPLQYLEDLRRAELLIPLLAGHFLDEALLAQPIDRPVCSRAFDVQ